MNISFHSKGDFDKTKEWLKRISQKSPSTVLSKVANQGTESLSSHTPKVTGETADGWVSEVEVNGNITEISWKNTAHPESGVSVAKLIELGHGTRTGGYVPPQPYIKEAMKPIWKTVDDKIVKELIK